VQTLPQYRFYATSLLFLYDGATPEEIAALDQDDPTGIKYSPDLRVKIVDFAHAITDLSSPEVVNAPFPPSRPDHVDRGYLKGLRSLKRYFVEYVPQSSMWGLIYGRIWKDSGEDVEQIADLVGQDFGDQDETWSDVSV